MAFARLFAVLSTTGHVLPVVAAASISNEIPLVTFDGAKGTTHKFAELNDPVMGGQIHRHLEPQYNRWLRHF